MKPIFKIIILLLLQISVLNIAQSQKKYPPEKTDLKFNRAYSLIKNYYVDTVNEEKLIEYAIIGMLKELDPHSTYLSVEEQKQANESLSGSFEGIGVQFQLVNDTIMVIAPISGGPSEKVGILSGDRIVTIDSEEATGSKITNNYVISRLRGEKGTKVTVGVYRKGIPKIIDFTITRDMIPIYSVDASYMIENEIGYIKLNRFSRTSLQEFTDAFKKLKQKGMQDLILDLRGNSGGFLDVAISLADEFIKRGDIIVYTEGIASPRENYYARKTGSFENGKLIILIDEGSASASEIVAGAVQDFDRGIIIGRRSFGKGLVQRPFELPDGSVMRLTTGRYFTPAGRHIQKPYQDGAEDYHKDLIKRYNSGELTSADSIHFPDSLKYFTKGNRVVYGGGGIMPDIFIPMDTTSATAYYISLFRKGVLNSFCLEYVDNKRDELNKIYPTFEIYMDKFIIDEDFMSEFYSFAEAKGVEKNEEHIKESKELIELQIKALIARNLWDYSAYFQIYAAIDDAINKALEVLKDDKTFKRLKISSK